MKRLAAYCFALSAFAFVSLRANGQVLGLYDDFSGKFIDPDKWFVGQDCGDVDRGYRECVLEIKGGQLRQKSRSYGYTNSDSGFSFSGVFLEIPNPSGITSLKADVVVKDVEVTGCPDNVSVEGQTRARLGGLFFNVNGTDIGATINLQRFPNVPKNTLRVDAFTDGLADSSCPTGCFVAMGTVSKGERVSISVTWEQTNHRFKFTLLKTTPAQEVTQFISYTESDTTPPTESSRVLSVNNVAPNCTSAPRPVAYMEAFFDNVSVGP